MKRNAWFNLILIAVIAGSAGMGCSRNPKGLTPIPGQGATGKAGTGIGDANGIGSVDPNAGNLNETGLKPSLTGQSLVDGSDKDRTKFAAQTVYFDFDSSVVKPSEITKIQTVATYLKANPNQGVLIEGHCDERGTLEYNRSLGERRSLSVREILVLQMGANADKVVTVSFGEDAPAVEGHNEAAWSKNRRGEFVLLTPKQ